MVQRRQHLQDFDSRNGRIGFKKLNLCRAAAPVAIWKQQVAAPMRRQLKSQQSDRWEVRHLRARWPVPLPCVLRMTYIRHESPIEEAMNADTGCPATPANLL